MIPFIIINFLISIAVTTLGIVFNLSSPSFISYFLIILGGILAGVQGCLLYFALDFKRQNKRAPVTKSKPVAMADFIVVFTEELKKMPFAEYYSADDVACAFNAAMMKTSGLTQQGGPDARKTDGR